MAESIETRHENWLRVVWGLLYVREGLQGYVDTKGKQQYQTFIKTVNAKCNNQTCDQCQINSKCQNGGQMLSQYSRLLGQNGSKSVAEHKEHDAHYELDGQTADDCLDKMIAVLEDPQELIHDTFAKQAANQMKKIKDKTERPPDIIHNKSLEEIEGLMYNTIHKKLEQFVVDEVERKVKQEMQNCSYDRGKDEREQHVEDLQQKLAKFYRKQLNSAPISPLLSDQDERLEKFYVSPKIVQKDPRKVGAAKKEKGTPVTSYRQLFGKTGEDRKNVFVVGEAGMGKSSCAAMCALKWANQFSSTKTTNEHDKNVSNKTLFESLQKELGCCSDDIKDIFIPKTELNDQFKDDNLYKEVEFLFYLTLRDSCDVCNLTDMIRDQLINRIYQQDERDVALSTMHSVLSNNKCVIIEDGLDEWTHPNDTNCSCLEEDKVIPYLAPTMNATVLITSRPWRMSQQRVKDTKIDTYLEIEGTACMGLLLQKVMDSLNETVTEKKTLPEFVKFVIRINLARLLSVPILSMLLVCLWFEGMYESLSVCDIYAFTVEMMFGRKPLPVPNVSQVEIPFPRCFQHTKKVQMYYSIVMEMAQLAFTTLFSNDQTSALVFKKVDILSHENLLFVLKSGILQETKLRSLLRKSSNYSFIHKTVQEFLAAIYMSYHPEEFHRVFLHFYQKNGDVSDISQVFVFMCGLDIKLANEMSALITDIPHALDSRFHDSQRVIISGFKEAKASQVLDIQLSLYNFDYLRTTDTGELNDLLTMNKSKVRSIYAISETSHATLQEVFSSSTDTLINVYINDVDGKYDLSACNCPKHVSIYGSKLTDIVVNTKNLVSLHLENVSKKVEYSIWQSIERESENLVNLDIACIKNISLFRQTLTRLKQLQNLTIHRTYLGELALLLPASVTNISLSRMTMTTRWLMVLVERLEKSTHSVKCQLFECTVNPITEYEVIKRTIPTSEKLCFKIRDESGFQADMVISVDLVGVRMTARSLQGLVELVAISTHRVECNLRFCYVHPITEYEKIKRYIQTSEKFESEIKLEAKQDELMFYLMEKHIGASESK